MTLIDIPLDSALHVDHFGLSIGSMSVGLPMSCTTDTVLLRYLDLVRLLERRDESRAALREVDVEVLATATRLPAATVAERLDAFAA